MNLQHRKLQAIFLDNDQADRIEGEAPTLYNVLQMKRRRDQRTITALQDSGGDIQTTPAGIARTMTTYLKIKYDTIPVERASIQRLLGILQISRNKDDMNYLAQPFEEAKIHEAIRAGRRRTAPGFDGIVREYYLRNWEVIKADMCDIFNQMFFEHCTTSNQKHGIIICMPKKHRNISPKNYRPITLLNSDYKCIARIMARHLRPLLEKYLTGTPYCGVPGSSILDAVTTIRDTIAYAECKRRPMCVLSLDFSNAFDKIAHEYLFQALRQYALPESFVTSIARMYEGATSMVQINGRLCGPIPIRCAIQQGCLLSMALYTLCIHPLLKILEQTLTGIQIGRRTHPIKVMAYADDVTIFVTLVTEFAAIEDALQLYEQATGACINPTKSRALAIGGWRAQETVLGIAYHQPVTILGITFWGTISQTTNDTWARITGKVGVQTQRAYDRDPNLACRIQYVHTNLLAKLWYAAQILPAPYLYTQKLTTAVQWYIQKGKIFKVPTTTLQRTKQKGGMGLIDITAKCWVLLLSCMHMQGQNVGSATASWLKEWKLIGLQENPPYTLWIPGQLGYLQIFAMDMAYVQFPDQTESARSIRKRLYNTLVALGKAGKPEPTMRIETLYPEVCWDIVWTNLNAAWIPNKIKITWYQVIHDIEPTNDRLARIKLRDDPHCSLCRKTDTILHCLTKCNVAANIWERITQILRMSPRNIKPKWTISPDFNFWPPQRKQTILWLIAHMVYYCVNHWQQLRATDYGDFLRRSRWKAYQKAQRREQIANYLVVLEG